MGNYNYAYWILLILVIVSFKLFIDHRKRNYNGTYKPYGNYENITSLKHDLAKMFVVQVIPLLIYGMASGDKLYDVANPINSSIGKIVIIMACYFVFHELVQPYVINKIPYF